MATVDNFSCAYYINLDLIYNSNDQRGFFNTMECNDGGRGEGKRGEEKDNFELFHIFG